MAVERFRLLLGRRSARWECWSCPGWRVSLPVPPLKPLDKPAECAELTRFFDSLTQYAPIGWRAVFYVSAGIAALVIIGAVLLVPADKKRHATGTVDWLGAFLITAGLTLVTFTLADGSGQPKGVRHCSSASPTGSAAVSAHP